MTPPNMQPPKSHRVLFPLSAVLMMVASVLICLCFSSCMTYQKALKKYGHLAKDSTTILVRDTVTTPRDSIVTRFKTDTTIFHRVYETLRTKLTVNRTPKETQITAECKPDTIIRTLRVKGPPAATFGVAAWYKTGFYVAIAALILMTIIYIFLYKLQLKLSISKR